MDRHVQWLIKTNFRYGANEDVINSDSQVLQGGFAMLTAARFSHSAVTLCRNNETLRNLLPPAEYSANDQIFFCAERHSTAQSFSAEQTKTNYYVVAEYCPDNRAEFSAYSPTLGFFRTLYDIDGPWNGVVDVGGAVGEHKEWLCHREGADCLVFVVSLSGDGANPYEDITCPVSRNKSFVVTRCAMYITA